MAMTDEVEYEWPSLGKWTLYDPATGRIKYTFEGDEVNAALNAPAGSTAIPGEFSTLTHYVVDGAIVPRPALPAWSKTTIVADGTDAAVLNVGVPARVHVDGVLHDVPDGVIEIAASVPATYSVTVDAFPYIGTAFTIEAT